MSIELRGEGGDTFRSTNGRWCFYLELAKYHFGWNPEGTTKPKGYGLFKSWKGRFEDGGYVLNDSQMVTPSDAIGLAAALERALSDRSVEEKGWVVANSMNDEVKAEFGGTVPPEIRPMLMSGDIDREYLSELIDFCQKGAIHIE